jgi:deoxyhypusine synthase
MNEESNKTELNTQLADLVTEAFESVMEIEAQLPNTDKVRGYDFDKGVNYEALFNSLRTTGFQATSFSQAVDEINKMIECKLKPIDPESERATTAAKSFDDLKKRFVNGHSHFANLQNSNCTIFLGYTSNMISCGVRESIKFLVKNKMVDCLVTTCGGVEEDFVKCFAHTYLGKYELDGKMLRSKGLNRIGNMVLPNDNYVMFENWLLDILDKMLVEQNENKTNWTPSKLINRLGAEINNEDSVYYWAHKNNIPVFCPGITDGAIGDTLFYHSFKNPGLRIDLVEDVQRMDTIPLFAINTGAIILGGSLPKHHILNANCMRNGLNYCVFVNTGQEFEGSDSGAKPDEAVSWAKIRPEATPVKIYGEASLIFPFLVHETFAKKFPLESMI